MFRSSIVFSLIVMLCLMPLASFRSVAKAQGRAVVAPPLVDAEVPGQGHAISSAQALAQRGGGVLLEWRSNSPSESLRLHIYRVGTTRRTFEAVSQDSLVSLTSVRSGAGYTQQWFDPQGTTDSIYYIESASLNRQGGVEDALVPLSRREGTRNQQAAVAATAQYGAASAAQSIEASRSTSAVVQPQLPEASLTGQWAVAAQVALKIKIKTDGWYRVTQQQMAAAGFAPAVDIRNLALFGDGDEFAIRTSKASGLFSAGDYVEFYGQGLDTLDTDTRVYYLLAGSGDGKRVEAESQADNEVIKEPAPAVRSGIIISDFAYRGWFAPLVDFRFREEKPAPRSNETKASSGQAVYNPIEIIPAPTPIDLVAESVLPPKPDHSEVLPSESLVRKEPLVAPVVVPPKASRNKKSSRVRRRKSTSKSVKSKPRFNHASVQSIALSFNDTMQIKERFNYNTGLPVGLNFFGSTIGTAFPLTETFAVSNLQANPDAMAQVEVALQGLNFQSHQVNVLCNNVLIGTLTNFFGREHKTQIIPFSASLLQEANNQFKIAPVPTGEFLGLDSITLTYPRGYKAVNDSLRFTARTTQTFKVDGFSTPNIQLLDITDLKRVTAVTPSSEVSGGGYAITVPVAPRKKARTPVFGAPENQPQRTLYALPQGQFQTPAGLSLNQPSTLNQSSNSADMVIIAAKDFIPSLDALKLKRQQEGLNILVVDVDDVYDEFSFGAHSTQALHDFLFWARGHWVTPPRYVLLGGDASYDPRGHFAIVMNRAGGGCTDTNNNAADLTMGQFGNPHNSGFSAPPCPTSAGLVISQINMGGGEKQGSWANSFIELRNAGSSPIDVKDWSVQYASVTGNNWQLTKLSDVTKIIQPGGYYLVQEAGFGGIFSIPTPDAVGNISMSSVAGKVALVNSTAALTGSCANGPTVVDFVAYGSTPSCFEGSGPVAISADFVPTKQVDTLFGIACSDDSLTDFVSDDGIPEIPVGRLPARTPYEMDLMVSKIVYFSKANVPQTALMVADTQANYYFSFEQATDQLISTYHSLAPSLNTQKLYKRILDTNATTGTINAFGSNVVTGSGTAFMTELQVGSAILTTTGVQLGTVAAIINDTSLTLTGNATQTYNGSYSKLGIPSGTLTTTSGSASVAGTGTLFLTDLQAGGAILTSSGVLLGTVASVVNNTSATLTTNANQAYSGTYKKQDVRTNIISNLNSGVALVNYSGHGNVNVWSGASIFTATDAQNLTNGTKLPLAIVADCLNGLFNDPVLEGLGETLLKAPNGGAVASYASSGETIPDGQQEMSIKVFQLLFGTPSMALGDVTKQAKGAVTSDLDVRRTWILLGDPSMKIW